MSLSFAYSEACDGYLLFNSVWIWRKKTLRAIIVWVYLVCFRRVHFGMAGTSVNQRVGVLGVPSVYGLRIVGQDYRSTYWCARCAFGVRM